MCGQVSWKRIVVFGLTFGLGVSVSGLFIVKELPELPAPNIQQTLFSASPAENKNCVPHDSSLKYERLVAKDKTEQLTSVEKPNLDVKKDKQKLRQEKQAKQKPPAAPQFYNPSKDSAEYQYLLHREKCFEAREEQ